MEHPERLDEMRLALAVEYDGSGFYGFQRQRESPTVQECLEDALGRVADELVVVHCSGRTDTGVHATEQVVHFDTRARRNERAWILGCNNFLPDGISALWVRPVPADFHARFSARWRSYRFRILNRWIRPGLLQGRVCWVRRPLDAERMHEAAQQLVGEHDFSAFRAAGCQARQPVRTIRSISVSRCGNEVDIEVTANAFLYHMVRNLAGTLVRIGSGERPMVWLGEVLNSRNRREAGFTATADGLYFLGPEYDECYGLPTGQAVGFGRGWNLS